MGRIPSKYVFNYDNPLTFPQKPSSPSSTWNRILVTSIVMVSGGFDHSLLLSLMRRSDANWRKRE